MFNARRITLGGLSCMVVDTQPSEDDKPELVAVFCHGFGAPGEDLVPLASEMVSINPELAGRTRFIFPAAPLSLEEFGIPGGRAWWPLDMIRLQAAIESGEFRDLRNECPELLPTARDHINSLLDEVREETGLPLSRIVLGGFSQGSMVMTDVTLRLPENPGALIIFSGTLLCEDQWRERAANRAGLKVVQSHGTTDQILPFQAAEWLRDLLTESGLEVDFLQFPGVHTIPYEALEKAAAVLGGVLSGER
ncbi:Phospholipase/Carboxylesterase [Maioricimonas rarisocia]|uniref:Phospholipase/Carboxylesterase n=1 Tax=Maioricimonas rarisocia TaxID=2528026 RepID=A0A517Z2V9_9PLAN|nr:phospholipase [Maioricimonas rarisocia]QDU36832.1 Phospholipase/Carboxylesterase [Maioricimonas rarisocia]